MSWLADTWRWVADRPWGSLGEWFSGLGALGAVATAFVIQRRDHKRQDERDGRQRLEQAERDEQRRSEQRHLEHRLALDRVVDNVRLYPSVRNRTGSQPEYSVRYDNSGSQPVFVTNLVLRHNQSTVLYESSVRTVLRGRQEDATVVGWQPIGDEVTTRTLTIVAHLEDHLGFKYLHDTDGRIATCPD